jgi:hypothetical protein
MLRKADLKLSPGQSLFVDRKQYLIVLDERCTGIMPVPDA